MPFKKSLAVFSFLLCGALTSCSGFEVREDLRSFSDNFSVSKCIATYKSASLSYAFSVYEKEEVVGFAKRDVSFSRGSDKEFYILEETASGKALEAGFSSSLKRVIEPSLEAYKETETKDGKEDVKPVSKDLFKSTVDSFFYTSTESGYAIGGCYYGDFLKLNFRYQEAMKIENEEFLVLNYDGLKPKEGQTGSIYIKANKLGMALDYKFQVQDEKTTMITSFNVTLPSETNL